MTAPPSPPIPARPVALRREGRRSPLRRPTVWGRVVVLLLALAFGRASVVAPCEAHGAPRDGAGIDGGTALPAHHGHAMPAAQEERAEPGGHGGGHGAPHGAECTCLGSCQHAPTAAWIAAAPVHVRAAAIVPLSAAPRPSSRPAVARHRLPHVLPFATAPPTPGI